MSQACCDIRLVQTSQQKGLGRLPEGMGRGLADGLGQTQETLKERRKGSWPSGQ